MPEETDARGPREYTRWTRLRGGSLEGVLRADVLHAPSIYAVPHLAEIEFCELRMTPDEARLIGVRLIEAAALAAGDRAVRLAPAPADPLDSPGGTR